MAERPVGILQFRRSGQVMIGRIHGECFRRCPGHSEIKLLESRGETPVICGDIEEVHGPVELVVRAEYGVEAPRALKKVPKQKASDN